MARLYVRENSLGWFRVVVSRVNRCSFVAICLVYLGWGNARADQSQASVAPPPPPYRIWNDTPPLDCPFPQSPDFAGLEFTGSHAEYENADTWYPSWASDGNMYSPFTDGSVGTVGSGSTGESATTGFATIVGDDPLNLKITNAATYPSSPAPYHGRYPCGSLVYNGIWYYGTYCLDQTRPFRTTALTTIGHGWGLSLAFATRRTLARRGSRHRSLRRSRCSVRAVRTATQSKSALRTSWILAKTWSIHPTVKPTLWLMELRMA